MSKRQTPVPTEKDSLTVRIGGWFEARATGAGIREVRIIAVPAIILLLAVAVVFRLWA